MKFNLIVCTYNRRAAIARLLESVAEQSLYPDEILIIDSSIDEKTEELISKGEFQNLYYYRVGKENSGLTRQRNYGLEKTSKDIEIISFLDDDIVLEPDYFKNLISTYKKQPAAIAVGGWIKDETAWKKKPEGKKTSFNEYEIDGYVRKLGSRNVLRKRLGLLSDKQPGFMPKYSHGFSTGFLPPSGKTYEVEYFMGGVSSYRKEIFNKIRFSSYFEGYGLYEDMDFCLRASGLGKMFVNTAARVRHLHEESGRPDAYKYGRMVIENGNHVWRLKYPKANFSSRLKHFSIDVLLMVIRFINGLGKDKSGIQDARGRFTGLWKILRKKN